MPSLVCAFTQFGKVCFLTVAGGKCNACQRSLFAQSSKNNRNVCHGQFRLATILLTCQVGRIYATTYQPDGIVSMRPNDETKCTYWYGQACDNACS